MKNISLLICGLSLLIMACQSSTKADEGESSDTHMTSSGTSMTGASTSMEDTPAPTDWIGMYKGVLPCADCDGIETTLILQAGDTYQLETKYLGKSEGKPIRTTSSFTWNGGRDMITLAGIKDAPMYYMVMENQLIQLDMSGNRIGGAMADKYILHKE